MQIEFAPAARLFMVMTYSILHTNVAQLVFELEKVFAAARFSNLQEECNSLIAGIVSRSEVDRKTTRPSPDSAFRSSPTNCGTISSGVEGVESNGRRTVCQRNQEIQFCSDFIEWQRSTLRETDRMSN